ncbi:MAG: carbohydrate ABC transporter permease [Thermosipho sp. (in: Bacteria)]|nr:carbohydrate ABC transporter permease [Thermosipho sp. (in: thermotogales)]
MNKVFIRIIKYFVLVIFGVFVIVPFLWTLVSSFKPMNAILKDIAPFSIKTFIPVPFTLDSYKELFNGGFMQSILFSILVGILTVVAGILINSTAGFAFAKFKFPGKKAVFLTVLISSLVPFEAIAVPLFIIVRWMHLLNTMGALVLPMIANGLCVFLFYQFFKGIPTDLMEAAIIDGASWWRIYWQIFLPLSKPAIVSASLLLFLSQWQSFLWPLVSVQSSKMRMVQVAIAFLTINERTTLLHVLLAAAVMSSIIPLLLIFPLQRYYIKGFVTSGMKG